MSAALIMLPAGRAAVERVRAEARRAVTDLTLPASRHEIAWMVLRGARNPKARRNQPNRGAPCAQPNWWRLATVYSHGGFCAND